jgi:hypothetical protein
MKILFVASEAFPLVKTGGLGDVLYSLPHALRARGADIRLVLPGYRALLRQLDQVRILGWLDVRGAEGIVSARILETRHPDFAFPLWVVDCPRCSTAPATPTSRRQRPGLAGQRRALRGVCAGGGAAGAGRAGYSAGSPRWCTRTTGRPGW